MDRRAAWALCASCALLCTAAPAAAASGAAYNTPGYRGTSAKVPTVAAPLPTPIALSPSGKFPHVLVDGAGTSHIVWITSDGVSADAVHYCRLPRGAGACDSSQVLVPQKAYGDGDDPSFNTSTDGARIVQVGQQIVILDYRYPTSYPKPDGSTDSNSVLEWVSEDGGNSFTGPGLLGNQPIGGGVVEFGPPNDPKILTATDGVTGGTYVQALDPGQFTSTSANLAGAPDEAYSGSLALDAGLPVAAFSDLSNRTLLRRWTGAGSASDASTWGPAATVAGDEPKLAGGPGGLFLMNRPAHNGPYAVQRVNGSQTGAPLPVSGADDTQYRDLTETPAGGLVAGWQSRGGASPGVSVRSSPDGAGWSGTQKLIAGADNGQLSLGAAADGGGIAVLNHTGATNGPGEIVATAYGQRRPTGAPGIAGIPGGGDPAATTTCQHVAFGAVKIEGELGCFLHGSGKFANDVISDGELNLNGLRIVPDPGVQIIVNAHEHTLDTTGNVSVIAQGQGLSVTLWHGKLHIRLPSAGTETDLFNFDMSEFAADLDGFPIDSKIDVKLTATGVRIPIDLKLPAVFGGVDGHTELVADSTSGLHVGALSIAISNAPIGPLLADFTIDYASDSDTWLGSGKLKFPPQPAGLVLSADVTFARGHFTKGDIDVKPFGFGLPVFTDVYIDDINGGLQLEPDTVITAGVGVGVIPIGTPAQFVNTMQINGDIGVTIANPFKIDVNGNASVLGVPVSAAHLLFISNGFLSLDGQFDLSLDPIISMSSGINAAVDLPHKLFSAEVNANISVLGYSLESAAGIISSSGMAVCGSLPALSILGHVTVGHHWNHDYTDMFPTPGFKSCDLSGYRVMTGPSARAAGSGGVPVTVPHADAVNLAVHGAGGAPTVVLTAPGGQQITPAVSSLQDAVAAVSGGAPAAAFSVPTSSTTGVILHNPAAGAWRVAALPDSVPIASVAESHTLPDPAIHARVLGRGRKLRLRYSLHPRPGMTVRFAEIGGRVVHSIGTAHGAAGTLSFAPADGPAGDRKIVALVDQDGLPRPRAVLAHYRAPGPLRPGRVGSLKVGLRKNTLAIAFGAASNARTYRIRVTSSDGKHRLLLTSGRHRSAHLGGFGPGAGATVTVTAYAANGLPGRSAASRAKPSRTVH